MRDDKTLFLFVFRDECLKDGSASSDQEPKAILTSVYADVGWEGRRILAAMETAGDIYFDRVSQIRMDRWATGRIALVGDAAACVSLLAGEGTGLAMAEAYVLAGELGACGDDYAAALGRYQSRMMPFVKTKQASAIRFASAFAPKTGVGIALRNVVTRLFSIPAIADYVVGRELHDDIRLPDYAA